MKDPEHALLIIKMGRKDLKAMEGMKENLVFFDDEVFGFHAQQAVEKTLKAWLSLTGVEYHRTHDLQQLFMVLKQHGESILPEFLSLMNLTNFAVQFRYESFEDLNFKLDRIEITQSVAKLVKHVEKLIQYKKVNNDKD